MKISLLIVPVLAILTIGCDKAKNLADKASSAVQKQIGKSTGKAASSEVDPVLEKLVNRTSEGAVFRKDLPFPENLEVRATEKREMTLRIRQSSEIETSAEVIAGTRVLVSKIERNGDHVRYTLEQSSFSKPSLNKEEAEKIVADPIRQVIEGRKPMVFRLKNEVWQADDSGSLHAAGISKQLSPVFDELLQENSLAPRPMWFSKKRVKPGDEFTLTDESLGMLVAGNPKGKVKIRLDSFDAFKGHPCGVFSITGNYNRKKFLDFEGVPTDEDVTIQTGKLWLSLVYPVVIKEELDSIQTFTTGGQGGLSIRGQGAVMLTVERAWKTL